MRIPSKVRARIPASTSNLGPGFDCLGLALSLFLDARLLGPSPGSTHVLTRKGARAQEHGAAQEDALLVAFERASERLEVGGSFAFEVESEIPVGRGFGSSGAAVAAGLLLANALAPRPCSPRELLAWGIEIEGPPDNVTAALFGGCTLCHPSPRRGDAPEFLSLSIDPRIGFALVWPPFALPTERARSVLPESISRTDAVENARRLPFLLAGLRSADPRLLAIGGEDRLHMSYRLPLIPAAREALQAAEAEGAWLATISGAGSGLVALGPHERMAAIAEAMETVFRTRTGGGSSRIVEPVFGAPQVIPSSAR